LIETIDGLLRDDRRLSHAPGSVALSDTGFGQEYRAVKRTGFVEGAHGAANRVTVLLVTELLFLAESDQEDAVAEGAGNVVQQQGRARLSLHVAAPDDVREMVARRIVEQLGGKGQLARFENADHHTGATLLLRTATFYAKFH
jgi:hypothetical protein